MKRLMIKYKQIKRSSRGKARRVVAFFMAAMLLLTAMPLTGGAPIKAETMPVVMAGDMDTTALQEVTTGQQATTGQQTTQKKTTADNKAVSTTERKAVWCSFEDLDFNKKTEKAFTKNIKTMFQNVADMGMNTVVVHVRPFSDAMYPSDYFPWSKIASGKQGKNPGYDPLKIMVQEAHAAKLRVEAWINPYRVSLRSTKISKLSKNNPARKWYSKKKTKRNVLIYGGQIYYNPAKQQVRQLIANGVKEIVDNYEVDAIHMDDYFYPSMTSWNYKKVFDAPEYKAYVKKQKALGEGYKSIVNWRRSNVNQLVKLLYKTVKESNPEIEFGISPAGNLDNLRAKTAHYVDIDRWISEEGYVDYICPQIYWGFQNGQYSYDKVLKRWTALCKESDVKLYVGLAMYRTVYYGSSEWKKSKTIMKRSVSYARKTKQVDGFYFFTYRSFLSSKAKTEKKNLVKELKKKS